MKEIDIEILKDFQSESKILIEEMLELLEEIEGDYEQVKRLEEYGLKVDRIMGGAKSLAMMAPEGHFIHKIGDYAAICKAVGYKASQIKKNPQLFDICVALLLDGTEMLQSMIEKVDGPTSHEDLQKMFTQTFLDRLRWASSQFGADVRASVAVDKSSAKPGAKPAAGAGAKGMPAEMDHLLNKLMKK